MSRKWLAIIPAFLLVLATLALATKHVHQVDLAEKRCPPSGNACLCLLKCSTCTWNNVINCSR